MTQNSISGYLAEHPGHYGGKRIKYYKKQIDVYLAPFSVVEYLVTNREVQGFKFIIYHDEMSDGIWVWWQEERKTEKQEMHEALRKGLTKKGHQS